MALFYWGVVKIGLMQRFKPLIVSSGKFPEFHKETICQDNQTNWFFIHDSLGAPLAFIAKC